MAQFRQGMPSARIGLPVNLTKFFKDHSAIIIDKTGCREAGYSDFSDVPSDAICQGIATDVGVQKALIFRRQ